MATIPQMVRRSLDGHRRALEAARDGRAWPGPTAPASELRGAMTIWRTLDRWGAVATVVGDLGPGLRREVRHELTDTGRELLAALEVKKLMRLYPSFGSVMP